MAVLHEAFIRAAAWELASRLAGGDTAPAASQVRQTMMQPPGRSPRSQAELGVLEPLARRVVEAVLSLSGRELDQQALARSVERAAQKYLLTHPQGKKALQARLAAEVPRLLNLPRLAELASRGLELAPGIPQGLAPDPEIIGGASAAFVKVLSDLEQVAETDFPVLLLGESGTGKELLARRLHRLSPRRLGPFVAVNCAAIAPGLLESELFGHVKGAFTGAGASSPGYLRAAEGGTLFLDEIGETGPQFQRRLLRVLEDGVVVPVGSHQGRRVDFRLVSASHRDLEEAAREGSFNQALLYRILVVPLRLPPLRQRREDLPALIDHFLAQACLLAKRTRSLAPETRRLMMRYSWPGNVRQLSNLIQRLVALSPEYLIGPELLPPEIRGPGGEDHQWLRRRLSRVPGLPGRRVEEVAALLRERGREEISNQDLRRALDCSDSTAGNILRALTEAGILEKRGQRGGRRYRLVPGKEE